MLISAACQSDYTEEALQKAREYTLQNARMLPETARNHIRYTTPALQTSYIFGHRPMMLTEYDHLRRNIDFNPITNHKMDAFLSLFVWDPPELGYSVITIGHSRRDMSYWEPVRVVFKHIVPVRKDYESARTKAVFYVTNNMLYLSNLERVRVRTSEAEVRETDFDLEYMFEEQFEHAENEWKNFLETLKKSQERKQYSLVWKTDAPGKRIVITGFGSVKGLQGWSPACGMVISEDKLNEYTLKIDSKVPYDPEENKK